MIKAKIHCTKIADKYRNLILYGRSVGFDLVHTNKIGVEKIIDQDIKIAMQCMKDSGHYSSDEKGNITLIKVALDCFLECKDSVEELIPVKEKEIQLKVYEPLLAQARKKKKNELINSIKSKIDYFKDPYAKQDVTVNPADENSPGVSNLMKNGFYVDPDDTDNSFCRDCLHRFNFQAIRECKKTYEQEL